MLVRISLAGNALCLVAVLAVWLRLEGRVDDAEAFTARVDEKAVMAHAKAHGLTERAGAQDADIAAVSEKTRQLTAALWGTALIVEGQFRGSHPITGPMWSEFSIFNERFPDPLR